MICNVCGHDQQGGRICDQCGLAMPAFVRPSPDDVGHDHRVDHGAPAAVPDAEPPPAYCRQCGAFTRAIRCPGCGIPVPRDE